MSKGLVYVVGPHYYGSTASVFREYGYEVVKYIEAAGYIVLTGGSDIDPAIYNEKPGPHTYFDRERDKIDLKAVEYGDKHNIPLLGVCRGHQLLHAYFGGKLIQDVDGHESGYHDVMDVETGEIRNVISVHHQMCIPNAHGRVLAGAAVRNKDRWDDVEAIWWDDKKSLGVQFHPEFGHSESSKYFFDLMERYYHGKRNISHE